VVKHYGYEVWVQVPDLDPDEIGWEEYERQMDEALDPVLEAFDQVPGVIEFYLMDSRQT
jgi:hypothetical protein